MILSEKQFMLFLITSMCSSHLNSSHLGFLDPRLFGWGAVKRTTRRALLRSLAPHRLLRGHLIRNRGAGHHGLELGVDNVGRHVRRTWGIYNIYTWKAGRL